MPIKLDHSISGGLIRRTTFLAILSCLLLSGCRSEKSQIAPAIEFSKIPLVDEGGTGKIDTIEGRVTGARPGRQIILYARSGAWYVQPFTDQPFTKIQPDSTWKNSTHLGTEYAALLVEPDYHPPARTDVLPTPGGGVVAVAAVTGEVRLLVPVFWQMWWFRLSISLIFLSALFAFHRLRLRQLARRLNARFEERLAERTRIARELHDTLLQGFLSASMQLHVAVEHLAEDSPVRPRLNHVQQLISQVIEEGRNTLRGLRSNASDFLDLGQAFSQIPQELAISEDIGFQVIVKGLPKTLHPIIRDEVYRIGREILVNVFRHSQSRNIEVELEYAGNALRVFVRGDGCGLAPDALPSGLYEQAEGIGARLKVQNRATTGVEIELSVPRPVAFPDQSSISPLNWFVRPSPRKTITRVWKTKSKEDQ